MEQLETLMYLFSDHKSRKEVSPWRSSERVGLRHNREWVRLTLPRSLSSLWKFMNPFIHPQQLVE